jgi:hypothetical protein
MRRFDLMAFLPLVACAETKTSIAPVLQSAPPAITGTSMAIDPHVAVGGYWSFHKLGFELARALSTRLEEALARAGYDTKRTGRTDLSARITAELSGSTKDLQSITRMEIIHDGKIVDRFEVKSPDDLPRLHAENYPEYVAVTLANRMMQSPALLALAEEPRRKTAFERFETGEGAVVALFDVTDASGQLDGEAQDQLSEYLSVRATQALGYRVLPRASVRELLLEKKAESYRACAEEACQIELGKALAAEKTLATRLIRLGASCALTTTLFDLKTETAELAASIKTKCQKESLLQGIDDLVDAMKKQRAERISSYM